MNLNALKEKLKKFFDEEENARLIQNNQLKDLCIKAIERGLPFDAVAEVLTQANIGFNLRVVKDELYLLAIKILKEV